MDVNYVRRLTGRSGAGSKSSHLLISCSSGVQLQVSSHALRPSSSHLQSLLRLLTKYPQYTQAQRAPFCDHSNPIRPLCRSPYMRSDYHLARREIRHPRSWRTDKCSKRGKETYLVVVSLSPYPSIVSRDLVKDMR